MKIQSPRNTREMFWTYKFNFSYLINLFEMLRIVLAECTSLACIYEQAWVTLHYLKERSISHAIYATSFKSFKITL